MSAASLAIARKNPHQPRHGARSVVVNPARYTGSTLSILELPHEVLQTICYHLDVHTFSVFPLSCKAFRSAAQSRSVLLRQLSKTIGWRKELRNLSTDELYDLFRLRASIDLLNAGALADVTIHQTTDGSSLAKAAVCHVGGDYLASVDRSGTILIYQLFQNGVELESRVRPDDFTFNVNIHDLVSLTFSTSGAIAALYKQKADTITEPLKPGTHDTEEHTSVTLFSFHRKLRALRKNERPKWCQERRDLACGWDDEPSGLSMAANGIVCIAWKNTAWSGFSKLMLYHRDGHSKYGVDSGRECSCLFFDTPVLQGSFSPSRPGLT